MFLKNNPVFSLLLGLCPALAVTTSVTNAMGMGVATIFVLTASNLIVSLLKNIIPTKIRIPLFIVVIVTFVTIVDLTMAAFTPELHKTLGIFIPLIVVNCIVLGRAESFAYKNTPLISAIDGLKNGIGFLFALVVLGVFRELLGNGTILGYQMMPTTYQPLLIMILPPGAFLVLGLTLGAIKAVGNKK